jgi:hypothetical protein
MRFFAAVYLIVVAAGGLLTAYGSALTATAPAAATLMDNHFGRTLGWGAAALAHRGAGQ